MPAIPMNEAPHGHHSDAAPFPPAPDRLTQDYGTLRTPTTAARGRSLRTVEKSPEPLIPYLSTVSQDQICWPVTTDHTATELACFISDAAPARVVVAPSSPLLRSAVETRTMALHALHASNAPGLPAPDEPATFLHASGTSGRPERAMSTHATLTLTARALDRCWHVSVADVPLRAFPAFHSHGMFAAMHVTRLSGSSMVVLHAFRHERIARTDYRDAWFITGDLAQRDACGCHSIIAREQVLMFSGGLNTCPEALGPLAHRLTGGVEIGVNGSPDRDPGEFRAGAIVLEHGSDECVSAVLSALGVELALIRIPRRARSVAGLPCNVEGKVQKDLLREDAFAGP